MDIAAARGTELINQGIRAARHGRADDAGRHFMAALEAIAQMPDPVERRRELGPAAMAFERLGHHDLALMAVQDALELDELLSDHRHFAEDLLTLGNIQMNLGRSAEAEQTYERALAVCLRYGYLDNAASANTNIALVMANSHRLQQALRRLQQSLDWLAKQAHPHAEINTRLLVIQLVDRQGDDPALAIEVARGLFARCAAKLSQAEWQTADAAFRRSVERYLDAHPRCDGDAWKLQHFPQLYAGE